MDHCQQWKIFKNAKCQKLRSLKKGQMSKVDSRQHWTSANNITIRIYNVPKYN